MIFRKAEAKDANGIAAAHIRSWQESYKGIIDQGYLDSLDPVKRAVMWENAIKDQREGNPIFVAENPEGKIVGFASFGPERTKKYSTDGELYAIYMLNSYKRRGIGTTLFYMGVKDLLSHGAGSFMVWVLEENPSLSFYNSLGPELAGEDRFTIAGNDHKEIALKWADGKELCDKLKLKSQGD